MAIPSYKTVLDGPDIDDALQQLNDRVAEGWTVGEKNGVPVTSGSPYYENNAKYYNEQAAAEKQAAAQQASLSPAAVLHVFFADYNGEKTAEFEGKRYEIYRTYNAGDYTELYLGERVGELNG